MCCQAHQFAILKDLSAYLKTLPDLRESIKLVDLHLFGGYQTLVDFDIYTMEDEVRHWVETEWPRPDQFESSFEREVDILFSSVTPGVPRYDDFEAFIREPSNWVTSGSSDIGTLTYRDSAGKIRRLRRSKLTTLLSLGTGQIYHLALSERKSYAKVVPKLELGKVRPVVNAGLISYLEMSFFDQWISSALSSHPAFSMLQSSTKMLQQWTDRMKSILRGLNLPLDVGSFDHTVSRRMLISIFRRMRRLIPSKHHKLFDKMTHILFNATYVTLGDKKIKYVKGILSGWRWTALLDSIVNYCQVLVCARMAGVSVTDLRVQGDDSDLQVKDQDAADAMYAALDFCNANVHRSKSYQSFTRSDYLRKVIYPDMVQGYPARAVPSLYLVNPISRRGPLGPDRMQECLSRWNKLASRLVYHSPGLVEALTRDLAGDSLLPLEICNLWLHTPRSFGGGGLQPFANQWVLTHRTGGKPLFRLINVSLDWNGSSLTSVGDLPALFGEAFEGSTRLWAPGTISISQRKPTLPAPPSVTVRDFSYTLDYTPGAPIYALSVLARNRKISPQEMLPYLSQRSREQYGYYLSHARKGVLRTWIEGGFTQPTGLGKLGVSEEEWSWRREQVGIRPYHVLCGSKVSVNLIKRRLLFFEQLIDSSLFKQSSSNVTFAT